MRKKRQKLSDEEIDDMVIAQTEDATAWDEAIQVKRIKGATLSLPAAVRERALFFARLHRENSLESWLKRIILERLDMEEAAFSGYKKEMITKTAR